MEGKECRYTWDSERPFWILWLDDFQATGALQALTFPSANSDITTAHVVGLLC